MMMMTRGRDRLSDLSDDLLSSHILTRLPLKEAVKCSILSSRWKSLWTQLPHLKFDWQFHMRMHPLKVQRMIDKVLRLHSVQVESFELHLDIYSRRGRQKCCKPYKIWEWINCAASKNARQLTIVGDSFCKCNAHPFEVPTSLFSCNCIESLFLQHFQLTNLSIDFGGFNHLVKCSLCNIQLVDDAFQKLVTFCPRLEKLAVEYCVGLTKLEICSSSLCHLKNLSIEHCRDLTTVKICSLSLYCLNFYSRTPLFSVIVTCPSIQDFSLFIGFEQKEFPRVIEIKIPTCQNLSLQSPFLETLISSMKQVKTIVLSYTSIEPLPCIGILNNFPNVEELKMCTECFKEVTTTEEYTSGLMFPLERLKKVHLSVTEFVAKEIALIGCLLRNAPVLATMTLGMPSCEKNHSSTFKAQLLSLKRSSAEASLLLIPENSRRCKKCSK